MKPSRFRPVYFLALSALFVMLLLAGAVAGRAAGPETAQSAAKTVLVEKSLLAGLDQARRQASAQENITLPVDLKTGQIMWIMGLVAAGILLLAIFWARSGWFARFSLNKKLYTGFGAVVALAVAVGLGGWFFLSQVSMHSHLETSALELDMMGYEISSLQKSYALEAARNPAKAQALFAKMQEHLKEYKGDFQAALKLNLDQVDLKALQEMQGLVTTYGADLAKLAGTFHQVQAGKKTLRQQGDHLETALARAIQAHENELKALEEDSRADKSRLKLQTLLLENLFAAEMAVLRLSRATDRFLADTQINHVTVMEKNLDLGLARLAEAGRLLLTEHGGKGRERETLAGLGRILAGYGKEMARVIEGELRAEGLLAAAQARLSKLEAMAMALSRKAEKEADAAKEEAHMAALALMALALLVGGLLSVLIARGIGGPLQRLSDGLGQGAQQVAAASGQVSSASQMLAQGASEQAASLEETSASMEQMASMTRQNAENAEEADNLMAEAKKMVGQANSSMGSLKKAMERINQASDETAKIINTIDGIAFQTNLLALNAAVEAARAGDHGAGFAVVAEEVRNLAQRAAQAAKNTQSLIEENLQNIKAGSELVDSTDLCFGQVSQSSAKVAELVGEIAAASKEQSSGIGQVSSATSTMDKVTQQVAANAEESAASAEELSAQAETMRHMVEELETLMSGGGGRERAALPAGEGGRIARALPRGARAAGDNRPAREAEEF